MNLPTKELIRKLAFISHVPCLSVYMTTHRKYPDNLQDSLRFKNLLKQLQTSLQVKYEESEIIELLEPLREMEKNMDFWTHNDRGIGVLRNKDHFEIFRLPEPVEELSIVADSFHLKPLRNYLYTAGNFHVLGLSIQDFLLFEGNRYELHQLDLPAEMPKTLTAVLGDDLTQSYSRSEVSGVSRGESVNMVHGYGSKKEEVDKDIEKFFRYVAQTVYENYSKPSGYPLILAALPEHHSLFRKVSKNMYLLEDGIDINPKAAGAEQLQQLAWKVMEPFYEKMLNRVVDRFGVAKSKGLGSDIVEQVAKAAYDGRVDTLLLEERRIIPGKIISNNDIVSIQGKDMNLPDTDDLLDDVGELVTRSGGEVLVLPSERMPAKTGLAAVYRY